MVPNIKKIAALTAFGGMVALASGSSHAQQQQQGQVTVKASGWYKVCDEGNQGKVCSVQFQVVTQDNRLVTGLNLVEVEGEIKRRFFRIVVPAGRSIPPGVKLAVDGKQASAIPFIVCKPRFCSAEVGLNDDLVKVFKAGGEIVVSTVNFQGTPQSVPVTLKGFTKAYDGPPVKREDAVSAQQDKLKEQLEQKVNSAE